MLIKNTLLSAKNLNSAFLSKTDIAGQVMTGSLKVGGGQLTLANSFLSDSSNAGYLRIDPQGNKVIIYDGVNNQELNVYSSSGVESLSLRSVNGAPSYSSIDVTGSIGHLKLMDVSKKNIMVSGNVEIDSVSTTTNPTSLHIQDGTDRYDISMGNRTASHIRMGGSMGASTTKHAEIQSYTTATAKGGNIYINAGGGNVGIGKTTAIHALDVNGSVQASNWFRTVGTTGWYSENYGGGIHMSDTTWVRTYLNKGFHTGTGNLRTDGTLIVGDSTLNVVNGGNFAYRGTTLFANTSGRVGIGTSNPTEALEVAGKIKASQGIYTAGAEGINFSDFGGGLNMTDTNWIRTMGGKGFYQSAGIMRTDGTLQVGNNGDTLLVTNRGDLLFDSGTFFAGANDKVGINTVEPTESLDVRGNIYVSGAMKINRTNPLEFKTYGGGFYMEDADNIKTLGNTGIHTGTGSITTNGLTLGSTFSVAVSGNMTYNTNTLFASTAGRVGIGTITPATTLDVIGNIQSTTGINIKGASSLSFSDYGGGFNMTDTTWVKVTGSKSFLHSVGIMRTDGTLHVGNSGATLSVVSGGNLAFRTNTLVATTGGLVGIGTATPSQKFHIVGGNQKIDDNGAFINKLTIGNANIQLGTTLGIDSKEIAFTTAGHIGTIGNNNLTIGTNGLSRLTILGTGDIESDSSIVVKNKDLTIKGTGELNFYNISGNQLAFISGNSTSNVLSIGVGITPKISMDASTITLNGNVSNNGTISSISSKVNNITLSEITGGHLSIRSSAMGGAVGAISLGSSATLIGNGSSIGIGVSPDTSYALDVNGATNIRGNIHIGSGNAIHSNSGGKAILKDTGTGDIEINAPSGTIYLGNLASSTNIYAYSDISVVSGTTVRKAVGIDGKLFYQGEDSDRRYLKQGGDTFNGVYTISSTNSGMLSLKRTGTGNGSYIAFYGDTGAPNDRTGWIGYPTANNGDSKDLSVVNEQGSVAVNGVGFFQNSIRIPTNGTIDFLNTNGPSINVAGNFDFTSKTSSYWQILDTKGDAVFRQYTNGTKTTEVQQLRVLGEADASPSSSDHGLQIGASSGVHMKMDGNEIMVRNGTGVAQLVLNQDGGQVTINGNVAWHRGNLTVSSSGPSGGDNGDVWIQY